MELGPSTSYHSKSQPKRSHDDPKTIQFHVFQPPFYSNFGNISQPGRKFSRSGPKIDPGPFLEQSRASKRAPEFRGQKIKRSHGGPFLAFQLLGNFGSSACCTTRQFWHGPRPNPAWIAEQEYHERLVRNHHWSSVINIGRQKSTLFVRNQHWSRNTRTPCRSPEPPEPHNPRERAWILSGMLGSPEIPGYLPVGGNLDDLGAQSYILQTVD